MNNEQVKALVKETMLELLAERQAETPRQTKSRQVNNPSMNATATRTRHFDDAARCAARLEIYSLLD